MDFLFELKKLIGWMLMPMSFSLWLGTLGLVICWRFRRLGMSLLIVAMVNLWVFSLWPVARVLMEPLEQTYPAYAGQPVSYVVVLGGGHQRDERVPVTSYLSRPSLNRLVEGIRIYDLNSQSKLLLSGYGGYDTVTHAEVMKQVALALGVPEQDILLNTESKDTDDEARAISQRLGKAPFALVSSASHLPRSVALFHRYGSEPVPAPAYYLAKRAPVSGWRSYLPNPNALAASHAAVHEYLGRLWVARSGG